MTSEAQKPARKPFGTTSDGIAVELYRLASPSGVAVEVITYGAAVHRVFVPRDDGPAVNIALGFATLEEYIANAAHCFGGIVGRFANRIGRGRFSLDGVTYELPQNDGDNSLHGGPEGFHKHVWQVVGAGVRSIALRRTSPAGEMGYPGSIVADVTYTLGDTSLRIDYRATTDAPTVVNLTNHTCWNLGGEGSGSVDEHLLTLNASAYTPIGPGLVPTGEVHAVDGTPLDFRDAAPIGARLRESFPQLVLARGYDHNFVIDRNDQSSLTLAARVEDPRSRRTLEVRTTEPGVQVYTGNFLDGTLVGPSGQAYRQGDCLALETQHFPDSPNQRSFPSTVLRPGQVLTSTTVYRLAWRFS